VKLRRDRLATRLLRDRGSAAAVYDRTIWFDPIQFEFDSLLGHPVLAHEAAHIVHQRPVARCVGAPRGRETLERDADTAAAAFVNGISYQPLNAGFCEVQDHPALIALAAGLILLWPKDLADGTTNPQPVTHLYETGWGYVPLIGSVDQMINGNNWWHQIAGTVFFVLDLTLVGAVARVSARGVMFKLSDAAATGIQGAVKGGGTEVQKRALGRLVAGKEAELMSEAGAKQLVSELTSGGSHLLVGAETGLNHSVVYVVNNGQIFKLHGGILSRAAMGSGREVGKQVSDRWVMNNFNTLSVYGPQALSTAGITDDALKQLLVYWEKQAGVGMVKNICTAGGCAQSQALIMRQLGLGAANAGIKVPARYGLPIVLEQARTSSRLGAHYVLNPVRALQGTAIQGGLAGLTVSTGAMVSSTTRMGLNQEFPVLVATPQESIELTPATTVDFPTGDKSGSFTIAVPEPEPKPGRRTHKDANGDTLWDLSRTYYGDPNKWPTIQRANPGVTNPKDLHVGSELVIP